VDGNIPVNPEPINLEFLGKINEFLTSNGTIMKKLKRATGALMNDFRTLSNSLRNVSEMIR
jgi:hypothetical protein